MKILIVYCHPSKNSFTYKVTEEFIKGLTTAGHDFILSDLYAMEFNSELSEEEYEREAYYQSDIPVSNDVQQEQEKIQQSDAIVFIYPVFWTEAPAKLVGWFDRVWSCGFAYGENPSMKQLERVLCIAIAGKTKQSLKETFDEEAMRTVMLGDRIHNRAKMKEMIILDGTTRWDEEIRQKNIAQHIKTAYRLGLEFDTEWSQWGSNP